MRKLYFFLFLIISFTACTNSDTVESMSNTDGETQQGNLNHRSYTEAIEIAQNSIKMLQGNSLDARSFGSMRTLNLQDGVRAIVQTGSRSNGSAINSDTLLYVFNFNDDLGFAVVSASRQTEGLIAVTELGNYDPAVSTGNPGFDTYMNMAKYYIAYEDQKSKEADTSTAQSRAGGIMYKPVYDTIFYKKIEPKITVKWGQGGVMGQYCSNGISGCSNTAAAQIMSYFKYPNSLTLTYDGRDVNSTALNWTAMCNHEYTYDGIMDDTNKQIGRLARQLGQYSSSTYYTNGTGTGTKVDSTMFTMRLLGYTVSPITNYNYKLTANGATDPDVGYALANVLSQGKLIYMVGSKDNGIGHAWAIDGCLYVKAMHRMMYTSDGGLHWSIAQELGTERTCHNHINWGWDGRFNGYFESYVFNVYNARRYDSNILPNTADGDRNYYNGVKYFTVSR